MAVPDSVAAATAFTLYGEDLAIDILGRRLPGLRVASLIEQDTRPPFVIARTATFLGLYGTDERFINDFYISVDVFTDGIDADYEGPQIIAAMTDAFLRSAHANDEVLDGLGWVTAADLVEPARRRADWANSEGPVQYADLPAGYARFTALYYVQVKRAHVGPHIYN